MKPGRPFDLFNNISDEFGLDENSFEPRILINSFNSFFLRTVLVLTLYLVLRTILISALFDQTNFSSIVKNLYEKNILEIPFVFGIALCIISFIIRLFLPIRFNQQFLSLLLWCFTFYTIEKVILTDLYFLQSKVFKIDYLAFFIFPPSLELVLKITYMIRSRKPKNDSIFHSSIPIKRIEDDKTTRKNLISIIASEVDKATVETAYSIGIVGDWGVGKTSFINPLATLLSEKNIVVRFSPWLASGTTQIIKSFFDTLKEALRKYDLSLASDLDKYFKVLRETEQGSKTNFSQSISSLLNFSNSAKTEFEIIDRSIRRINKRIVVFIDDIDRLEPSEVIEVLKLIRNTASFQNVFYISCYDKLYVLNALHKLNKRNLAIALDKFFDLELPLSPIPNSELISELERTFFKKKDELTDSRSVDNIKDYLISYTLFTQFREINKLSTALNIDYELYGKRLHFADFFYFEILKVKFPFLPALLFYNVDKFLVREGLPSYYKLVSSSTSDGAKYAIEDYLRSHSADFFVAQSDIELIAAILEKLLKENDALYTFRDADSFSSYFYHTIPESKSISKSEIRAAIENANYRDIDYFQSPFDAKKQFELLDFLADGDEIKSFSKNSDKIFKFLLFLVEWSNGQIPFNIFNNVYGILIKPELQRAHYEQLMLGEPRTKSLIVGCIKINSALFRAIQYQGFADVPYTTHESLRKINSVLFEDYLMLTDSFSNETFDMLHGQIEYIDSLTKKISLKQSSLNSFRAFIDKHRKNYLDLNIRSAMIPNYDLRFVFEPFTKELFSTKAELHKFIEEASDCPERRKQVLISYLNSSNDNENQIWEFILDRNQLGRMPVEFLNAWRGVQQNLKDAIKMVISDFETSFINQTPPEGHPNRNDHFYQEFFSLDISFIEVKINPYSDFWRFGFRFLEHLPESPFNEWAKDNTHENSVNYICISVGQPIKGDTSKWSKPDHLWIDEYNIKPSDSDFQTYQEFSRTNQISVSLKKYTKTFTLEIKINESVIGKRQYDLSGFNFFTLSAWCDNKDFSLSSKIQIGQPLT